jgi:hypothetical protein
MQDRVGEQHPKELTAIWILPELWNVRLQYIPYQLLKQGSAGLYVQHSRRVEKHIITSNADLVTARFMGVDGTYMLSHNVRASMTTVNQFNSLEEDIPFYRRKT